MGDFVELTLRERERGGGGGGKGGREREGGKGGRKSVIQLQQSSPYHIASLPLPTHSAYAKPLLYGIAEAVKVDVS